MPIRRELQPLVVDLCCGLGGWAEGFLSEGWRVIGFDTVRRPYPGQLVLQDVLTIHGAQFATADAIVASPPCQAYSSRAMPWSRLVDQMERSVLGWEDDGGFVEQEAYSLPPIDNRLFTACFRIQRQAIDAAGRYIPMVVENVFGAEKWVGPARWHYGSYFLWGDVPALMPCVRRSTKKGTKVPGISWSNYGKADYVARAFNTTADQRVRDGLKTTGHKHIRAGHDHTRHLTNPVESNGGVKLGGSWFYEYKRNQGPRCHSSQSVGRALAAAEIAKIPFELASHIARCFQPRETRMDRKDAARPLLQEAV